MSNPTSIREQLTFKAWLQVFLIFAAVVFTFMYTLPKLDAIGLQVSQTNDAVTRYQQLEKDGIPFGSLVTTIQKVGDNKELTDLISRSSTETQEAIKKDNPSEPYLSWVTNALSKSDKDRAILSDMRARVNSIVPTLSPVSNNMDENSVTLRDYITFMERDILRRFNIESLSPLGIDGITYENKGDAANPIGHFQMDMNFSAPNKDVVAFLDYINKTGTPEIFDTEGILPNAPAVMSNPLITIDSLSLTKMPSSLLPNEENTGRVSLHFYVRGSSSSDQDALLETFNKRRADLGQKISDSLKKCQDTTCVSLDAITLVKHKFDQLNNSFQSTLAAKKGSPVETIYMIGQQLQSLKAISDEFENIK